jgi:hypothetical protein
MNLIPPSVCALCQAVKKLLRRLRVWLLYRPLTEPHIAIEGASCQRTHLPRPGAYACAGSLRWQLTRDGVRLLPLICDCLTAKLCYVDFAAAFINPDDQVAVVVLSLSDADRIFQLWVDGKVVKYIAPPQAIIMANWGMGCDQAGNWFTRPSYLGFWTAPTPWGPWTQVHEEEAWTPAGDPGARAYQPQIAPKWISQDGRSFWLVWTDFQLVNEKRPYYCFNLQKFEVLIE